MLPETVARLARLPRIVAASRKPWLPCSASASWWRSARPGFGLLSGDDATRARGHAQWRRWRDLGDGQRGARADEPDGRRGAGRATRRAQRELDARLAGLHQALFLEANPIPVKWALERMGIMRGRPAAAADAAGPAPSRSRGSGAGAGRNRRWPPRPDRIASTRIPMIRTRFVADAPRCAWPA